MLKLNNSQFALLLFITVVLWCGNPNCSYANQPAAPRVIVNVSGVFSTEPSSIRVTGTPGPFPMPALLGGSFHGVIGYSLNGTGILGQVYREFFLATVDVKIRDSNGAVVHTIVNGPNPFKITNGEALFGIGASGKGQPGHVPLTPTDLQFQLLGNDFLKASASPPNAAAINGANVGPFFGFGAFIELDSETNLFHGWNLPITSMSLSAVEIPEPSTLALFAIGCAAIGYRRRFVRRVSCCSLK
jgi:hypothetical protein